ncbi:MAG: glycosyltransferase [Chloroflexi bacterium]|nr:glycosyltransferase [Chloroflexota bacterium]
MERSFFAGGEALLRAFGRLADRAGEIDVVHAHAYDWPAFAFAELLPAPVLHTVHLQAIVPSITELLRSIFSGRRHAWYATVSRTCAATYPPPVAFDRVVYNGIRIEDVPFGAQGRGYLLFVGRIAPEKGLADAIEVARRLGRPLQVAGGIYDRDYYDRVLAPHLTTPWLRYHGAVERSRLYELMAGADALLMPVQWDEALGMVTIEAQAAGTPVVAYRRGGLVEVVNDGETGRLAMDLDGLVNATEEATQLNRAACRENVAARFTLDRMVDEYERLYRELLLP